jgi:hypothetical protein
MCDSLCDYSVSNKSEIQEIQCGESVTKNIIQHMNSIDTRMKPLVNNIMVANIFHLYNLLKIKPCTRPMVDGCLPMPRTKLLKVVIPTKF